MHSAPRIVEGLTEANLNCGLFLGLFNVIAKVSAYNGKSDDAEVRVDIFTSVGIDGTPNEPPCDETRKAWSLGSPVNWRVIGQSMAKDGDLCFRPGSSEDSKVCDPHAFVRDHYLYAQFDGTRGLEPDGAEFWLTGYAPGGDGGNADAIPGFPMRLSFGFMVGRLHDETNNHNWVLEDATLAGFTTHTRLVDGFQALGVGPCLALERFVLPDVYLNAAAHSSADECDAISAAWKFSAHAVLGIVIKDSFLPPPNIWKPGPSCVDSAGPLDASSPDGQVDAAQPYPSRHLPPASR